MRRRILCSAGALATTLGLAGCAPTLPTYTGADAGRAVIGIGAGPETRNFMLNLSYRRVGSEASGMFHFSQLSLAERPDYRDGVIRTELLAPGEYELYTYSATRYVGMTQTSFKPRQPFSIRFTIRPGETTYLGNYEAYHVTRPQLFGLLSQDVAIAWVVSSRITRDMALLSGRDTAVRLSPATDATPDPRKLGHPLLRATPP